MTVKIIAYNIVDDRGFKHMQVDTKAEAREWIAEVKRYAKIEGVAADKYVIEPVR